MTRSTPPQILIVDDDRPMREMLASVFDERGFAVDEAGTADEALEIVAEHDCDVVLSDIRMPGRSGVELVGELRRLRPATPVILMTAFGSIDSAVEAMRVGAFDYITKPFEPSAITLVIDRALELRALERENQRLRRAVDERRSMGDLIGESRAMRDIFALISKIAHKRTSVLITGESGTGKEVVARTLHFQGASPDSPFVPINCSALPEGLLESELFGHVKGAFTGAHTTKAGLFEEANGGTLFLDEIGDMSLPLQAKLLRVLQDQEIRPVGGTKTIRVDVRIVAATNQDLEEAMSKGKFREDLFYRLSVIPIHIPPLRERTEDIPALIDAFIRKHSTEPRQFGEDALRVIAEQRWPGNARELENLVERTLALSDQLVIGAEDLPLAGSARPADDDKFFREAAQRGVTLHELEDRYIAATLELMGGNKTRAAALLAVDRKTLYRRGKQHAPSVSD